MKGQIGTEYIIVLAAVIIIAGVATVLTLNLIKTNTTGTPGSDWNKFEGQYAELNIISIRVDDGAEQLMKTKPTGGYTVSNSKADYIQVVFEISENVQDYNVILKQGQTKVCSINSGGAANKGKITSGDIPNCAGNQGKTVDISVTVRYSELRSERDIEKNAIKFTT